MGNGFVLGHSSSGSLVPAVEEAAELGIESKLMNQVDSIHPGEHLAEILDELGISQYRLAKAIDVPPRRINEIVHGRRSITADTALRIGQALTCISHHPTVEARDTTARTSLRLLAVLNVLFKYACARQAAHASS